MTDSPDLATRQAQWERADWVSQNILPHEHRIRALMIRWRVSPEDREEMLQEAYCRIANLPCVDGIDNPSGYFFSIVRNIMIRHLRRQRIVSFEAMADIEGYVDQGPTLEDQAHFRHAYDKVLRVIEQLPLKCRKIVKLRKIEDWPRKDIAAHLGISEKTVETQVRLGIRAIRAAWCTEDNDIESRQPSEIFGARRA